MKTFYLKENAKMKKTFIVLMVSIMLLSLLSACTESTKPTQSTVNETQKDKSNENNLILYENTKYNFTLNIPKKWSGKYVVREKDNNITFFSKANQPGGELFNIQVWEKEKWNKDGDELIKLIHISKIAEQGDTVYTINTPTDVQYDNQDEKKKTQYLSMADDINSIKASFKLK
jgi:hypothetical protein